MITSNMPPENTLNQINRQDLKYPVFLLTIEHFTALLALPALADDKTIWKLYLSQINAKGRADGPGDF